MCTFAVCGLAHYFERAGIATVVIALIPQHAEKIRPPRTLSVPFILGRPLGAPKDPAFQHRVLDAALGLLNRTDGPVFVEFEEDAPAVEEVPTWVCPVSFAQTSDESDMVETVMSEIQLLNPWYEKGIAERGASSFGVADMELEEIVRLLADFANGKVPSSEDIPIEDMLKRAAEDLKAFYNESAVTQPGNPSAKDIEDWYWGETEAGKMIRQIKKSFIDAPDSAATPQKRTTFTAGFLLVPGSQAFRDA